MLKLEKCFQLQEQIASADFVLNNKLLGSCDVKDPKLIGQECSGLLLYIWHTKSSFSQSEQEVTHFGTYDPSSKKSLLVLIHDRKLNVVNGTINSERTFLGFVTKEEVGTTGAHGKHHKQNIYKAFVAEISPPNRIFYLNLEREFFLKLQFICPDAAAPASIGKESHMLVFLHKDSIGVYHLPMAKVGNNEVIMCGEPRKEQIVLRFWWSQYDPVLQQLYILVFHKTGHDNNGVSIHRPQLAVYQLLPNASFEKKIEVFLELPIPYTRITSRCHYEEADISDVVTDKHLNLRVLSSSNGNLCVCYQGTHEKFSRRISETSTKESDEQEDANPEHGDLKYYIALIHLNKQMTVTCPQISLNIVRTSSLFFSCFGGYVMVHLPRFFTHLLNVDSLLCNHILWHDTGWKANVESESDMHCGHFIIRNAEEQPQCYVGVYDHASSTAFVASIHKEHMVKLFSEVNLLPCRTAILHFTLVYGQDTALGQEFLEVLCQDIVSFDVVPLFQEFLLGATYVQLQDVLEWSALQFFSSSSSLPLSNDPPSMPEANLSSINYSNLRDTDIKEKEASSSKIGSTGFWTYLSSLRKAAKRNENRRFLSSSSRAEIVAGETSFEESATQPSDRRKRSLSQPLTPSTSAEADRTERKTSFIARFGEAAKSAFGGLRRKSVPPYTTEFYRPSHSAARKISDPTDSSSASSVSGSGGSSARVERLLASEFPFCLQTYSEEDPYQLFKMNKMLEALSEHLSKWLPSVDARKLFDLAEEYLKCQLHQTRNFIRVLINISEKLHSSEFDEFLLFERFYLAVEELCFPLPAQFISLFFKSAFRSLQLSLFLQYCDNRVFRLNESMAKSLLNECGNASSHADSLLQIISRLPMDQAVNCLREWQHPMASIYLAQHFAAYRLANDDSSHSQEILRESSDICYKAFPDASLPGGIPNASHHPPLNNFVKLLQKEDVKDRMREMSPTFKKSRSVSAYSMSLLI